MYGLRWILPSSSRLRQHACTRLGQIKFQVNTPLTTISLLIQFYISPSTFSQRFTKHIVPKMGPSLQSLRKDFFIKYLILDLLYNHFLLFSPKVFRPQHPLPSRKRFKTTYTFTRSILPEIFQVNKTWSLSHPVLQRSVPSSLPYLWHLETTCRI